MRVSRVLLKEMPPLKGNFVNPRATVSLQPESFRFPAPNSQPEYENDMTSPNKEHDIDTIQYAPRSSRLYKEPQTLIVSMHNGEFSLREVEREGTVDAPYMPLATAAETGAALRVEELEAFQQVLAVDWTKPNVPIPELGQGNYQYGEVSSSEWDRKD